MFSEGSNFALAAILRLTQSNCIRYIRITITKGRLTAMFVENENDVNRIDSYIKTVKHVTTTVYSFICEFSDELRLCS